MQYYADKVTSYFDNARTDISPLLPAKADRVLEIGCGSGATLAWLKASGICRSSTGIELFAGAAAQARERVDSVLCGPAQDMLSEIPLEETFDLVLCLDVLEHMADPWKFLEFLQPRLARGGLLVASIPNVRYIGVLAPLLFAGQWRYREDGVLDKTHLRFFTRSSAMELMSTGALRPKACIANVPAARTSVGKLDRITFGLFKEFCAFQWVISARRLEQP